MPVRYGMLWVVVLLAACSDNSSEAKLPSHQLFFDDFSYAELEPFINNGWSIRAHQGHPGIAGANWGPSGVIPNANLGWLTLQASTDGRAQNTQQVQICQQRKFLYGSYAARVHFHDQPISGEGNDQVVHTFYANGPYVADFDPDYSEIDFEYLPNGGWWAGSEPALWVTSWETFAFEPWQAVNLYQRQVGSLQGWHWLMMTATADEVAYYLDGELLARHAGGYAPEVMMSLNFNQWFTDIEWAAEGQTGAVRTYQHSIDWVLHVANEILTPAQMLQQVQQLQGQNIAFQDKLTTPAQSGGCEL